MSKFEKKYKSSIGPDGSKIKVDKHGLRVDKYGHRSYFSQENRIWVLVPSNDLFDDPYDDDAVFYNEDVEDRYEGFFDYNDGKVPLENVKKKTYPN